MVREKSELRRVNSFAIGILSFVSYPDCIFVLKVVYLPIAKYLSSFIGLLVFEHNTDD